jgi:hypothetical protein
MTWRATSAGPYPGQVLHALVDGFGVGLAGRGRERAGVPLRRPPAAVAAAADTAAAAAAAAASDAATAQGPVHSDTNSQETSGQGGHEGRMRRMCMRTGA